MLLCDIHNRTPKSGILFTDLCVRFLKQTILCSIELKTRDAILVTTGKVRGGGGGWCKGTLLHFSPFLVKDSGARSGRFI